MNDKIFLDTNIILYQFSTDEQKQNKSISIVESALNSVNYVISYQVIQEFSNVALSKKKSFFTNSELMDYTDTILKPLCKFFYTEDLNHLQKIDKMQIINPFLN